MESKTNSGEFSNKSAEEELIQEKIKDIFINNLNSDENLRMKNIILTALQRQTLSRIIYYDELYRKIVNIPGSIIEFGIHWGNTLTLLTNLRGIYEPYNYSRKIIGFDTFEGFPSINEKDGDFSEIGDFKITQNYEKILEEILNIHELNSPLAHIKKHELISGDICETLEPWLINNPHLLISMAIIDVDIYKPTKHILEKIIPRLTKGSLIVFDELNHPKYPGETIALLEEIGLNNLALRKHPHQTFCSYAVWE